MNVRALGLLFLSACAAPSATMNVKTFDDDVAFLRAHTEIVVLGSAGGARVAVAPRWQGRVMTSTVAGTGQPGFGWINEELIAAGQLRAHINAFGGEDRFWLGPEGGQFSIFFDPGASFDLEHWQTPPLIDTEPYDVVARSSGSVTLTKRARLRNYSNSEFDLQIERTVGLVDAATLAADLGSVPPPAISWVAFESVNRLENTGSQPWTRSGGLLSIWILGMFKPSPATTVVVPFETGAVAERGAIVNDAYFGKVPADRLVIGDGVLFFSGDGQLRSKIGLGPRRAKPVLGSWDAQGGVLTIVTYDLPAGAADYVNSMWQMQDEPFSGDVVNSYNDGPPAPGKPPLGPFYELETSSPAAALAPGESIVHRHRTMHLRGDRAQLDAIARRVLGVGIDAIERALH